MSKLVGYTVRTTFDKKLLSSIFFEEDKNSFAPFDPDKVYKRDKIKYNIKSVRGQ